MKIFKFIITVKDKELKNFFKKLIECIKITFIWLVVSIFFVMCDFVLYLGLVKFTGLLKTIILILFIAVNILHILLTIYCLLSLFSKKLAKYVDKVLDNIFLIYGVICFASFYYFYLTRAVLKTPFKEFNLLLPFIMIFIYVSVSVFCYYKAKRDYPDEKIISINLGHFPFFLIWVFTLLPMPVLLLFDETKRILISYIFVHLLGLLSFILFLYISIILMFPRMLTNKRVLNYFYIFKKSKRVILLSDIERIKKINNNYYEGILKNGEKVDLFDHSIREKGAFVKKIMETKEKAENIDKGEDI